MKDIVMFYDDEDGWYHAYCDDAIVISKIMGYQLYSWNCMDTIGFPKKYLRKVTENLGFEKIGYTIYGTDVEFRYSNSKYQEWLKKEIKPNDFSFDEDFKPTPTRKVYSGSFTVQFNDEEFIERKIGVDINRETELVNFVINNDVGSYKYGDDTLKILKKNIEVKEI